MKKITALVISLCFCIPTAVSLGACGQSNEGEEKNPNFGMVTPAMPEMPSEGLEYELNEDGTGYIFKGVGTCMEKNIRIADEYESLPVVGIAAGAFNMAIETVSVTVGANVAEIGLDAFGNLTTVQAFFIAEGNTSYKIMDDSLYTADGSAIIRYAVDSSRTSYSLPETVKEIKEQAFNGCDYLTSLTIPEGVETIGGSAFSNCDALTSVHIPASVSLIGGYLTKGSGIVEISVADGNTAYKSVEGVLYTKDGKDLLEYPSAKQCDNLILPETVETVKAESFSWCEYIKSVVFTGNIEYIETSAFTHCSALESIEFDKLNQVYIYVKDWAFSDCTELKTIKFGFGWYVIEDTAFNGCTKLSTIDFDEKMEEWEYLMLYKNWLNNIPLEKVICTDGEISYPIE